MAYILVDVVWGIQKVMQKEQPDTQICFQVHILCPGY